MRQVDVSDLAILDILTRWPETLRVFIDRRMKCVGCPIATFHTLTDAADEHGQVLAELEQAMLMAIAASVEERAAAPRAALARGRPRSAAGGADP